MMKRDDTLQWVGGILFVTGCILFLCSIASAQFSDVYGDPYGNTSGNVYMTPPSPYNYAFTPPPAYTAPPIILTPPYGSTSPSVQFGQNGLTYTYPGQGGGPAVVIPPTPTGQIHIYFGQGGEPDVLVLPDGRSIYSYPGKR